MDIEYILKLNNFKGFKCDTLENVIAFNEEVANMPDKERWESLCDVAVLRANIMLAPGGLNNYIENQSYLTEANDQLFTYAMHANPKLKPKTADDMRIMMQRLSDLDDTLVKEYGDVEKDEYGKLFENELKQWSPTQ